MIRSGHLKEHRQEVHGAAGTGTWTERISQELQLVLKIQDETIEAEAPERISDIRSIPEEGHCLGIVAYPAVIFTKSLELEQVYT